MTPDRVSTPPDDPERSYVPPSRRYATAFLVLLGVAIVAAAWWVTGARPEPVETPATVDQDYTGPPTIKLKPSLMVPGPMQVPRAATERDIARPDEAMIFRVEVKGSGYVLIGLELSDGKLLPLYRDLAAGKPISGSQLLYDSKSGKAIAYAMGNHRGQSVTFLAALSSSPWESIPERFPEAPRSYPDLSGEPAAKPPPAGILAWDRFTVPVAREIPVQVPKPLE